MALTRIARIVGTSVAWTWIFVVHAWSWPTFLDGEAVRIVSPDLMQVYAVGTVVPGAVQLQGSLPREGTPLRILSFPPSPDGSGRASSAGDGSADTPRVVRAVVGREGEVWLSSDDGTEERTWSNLLAESGRTLVWLPVP